MAYLAPRLWFLENPDTRYLKTREVVAGLPYVRVDYCRYGAPRRKRTRLWTNVEGWTPKLCDRTHLVDGRHTRTAQRAPGKGVGGARLAGDEYTLDELHALPRALCQDILAVCSPPGSA
eukprot:12152174-Alexandrium_andersonii.AAC.1